MMDWLARLLGMQTGRATTDERADESGEQRRIAEGLAKFEQWRSEHALPAVFLDTDGPTEPGATGSRIGGPAWLPEGEDWPTDSAGKPLSFLAQLDFAQLPKLPDFPDHGVMQFFIGTNDLYGADFKAPERGDFRVIWREETGGAGALHDNMVQDRMDSFTPLDDGLPAGGLKLTGRAAMHSPSIDSWLVDRDLTEEMSDAPVGDAIYERQDEIDQTEGLEAHHMGGHPEFTQSDYRGVESYKDVDRVLLNLWSQPSDERGRWSVLWGDAGQGQFTIRRADLLERRFDRALYQWDCG